MLLSGANSIELVVVHVALLRLGVVVVPVNSAYREREVTHIVRDCRPVMAIGEDRWAPWIASVDEHCVVLSVDEAARGVREF